MAITNIELEILGSQSDRIGMRGGFSCAQGSPDWHQSNARAFTRKPANDCAGVARISSARRETRAASRVDEDGGFDFAGYWHGAFMVDKLARYEECQPCRSGNSFTNTPRNLMIKISSVERDWGANFSTCRRK
jgi:hypothetical protein